MTFQDSPVYLTTFQACGNPVKGKARPNEELSGSQSVQLHMEKIHEKLFYFWTSGSERCRLKKKFMDDGQRPITIAHHEPLAQVS